MSILSRIFGDRYAQRFGEAILQYFEREYFPRELLQYPKLNVLYCEARYDKARSSGRPDGEELIAYLNALLAVRRKEMEDGK